MSEKVVLLSGPRQVGKTFLSKQLGFRFDYYNFDSTNDRRTISAEEWDRDSELVIFDELHKKKKWKSWLKGIYDTEGVRPRLLVTGSGRMDTFKKGGESLAGRHFYYRLHPIDVKEASHFMDPKEALDLILEVGGFPEPFLKGSTSYAKRWRRQHVDVIIREDLIDLEKVRDIKSIEILIEMLKTRVGSSCSYSSLARDLQVSVPTVKHWLQILENLFIIFSVRPFNKNISRSILKEPKYYFYDTGAVENGKAARLENEIACSLIKQLHFIEDTTGVRISLNYLRDKDGNEIDFLTMVDGKPVDLVEVKLSDDTFSKHFFHFMKFFDHDINKYQLVYNLKKKKMKDGIRMWPVDEYLVRL